MTQGEIPAEGPATESNPPGAYMRAISARFTWLCSAQRQVSKLAVFGSPVVQKRWPLQIELIAVTQLHALYTPQAFPLASAAVTYMLPNQNGCPSKATAHLSYLSRSVCSHVSAVGLQETPVRLFTWLEISYGWSHKSLILPALPPPPHLIKYTNWPPVKHLMQSHLKQQCTDFSTKNLSKKKKSEQGSKAIPNICLWEREKKTSSNELSATFATNCLQRSSL